MNPVKQEIKIESMTPCNHQADESEPEDYGFVVLDYTGQKLEETETYYDNQLDLLPNAIEPPNKLQTIASKHEGPFQCLRCSKEFQTRRRLKCHTRLHDRTRQFNCDLCDRSFWDKAHLKVHRRIHTNEKPYECSYCHWAFAHKPHLKEHERIHSGERPFVCADCGKAFKRQVHRSSHIRNMHTAKP